MEPLTTSDLIGRTQQALEQLQQGPLAGYMPYTRRTAGVLHELADLNPETLAVMHGSSFRGPCGPMLRDLAEVLHKSFDVG